MEWSFHIWNRLQFFRQSPCYRKKSIRRLQNRASISHNLYFYSLVRITRSPFVKIHHSTSWMKTLPANKQLKTPQRNRPEINMAQKSPEMIHGGTVVSMSSSRKAIFLFFFCSFGKTTHLVFGYESSWDSGSTLVEYSQIPSEKLSVSAFAARLFFLECYYELQQPVFPVEQVSDSAQLLRALDNSGLLCTGKKPEVS